MAIKANLITNSEKRAAVKADAKAKPAYLNQRNLFTHFLFGPYVLLPILAGLVWLGGLLALIGIWTAEGKPRYMSDEATIVFVSDVGAANHTLFICITAITAVFYILSLFAERWLRHVDRLPVDVRRREQIFDWIAIVFGTLGAIGLILLGVFDAFDYSTIHWSMTLVFIVGVAISAIFQSAEVWSLHKDHPDRAHLKRNSMLKLVVVGVAVACAIAFGSLYAVCDGYADTDSCNKVTSGAAAMEWTTAFILSFYFATLAFDLWPAGKTSPRYLRRLARWQEMNEPSNLQHDFTGRKAFAAQPEQWQATNGRALPDEAVVDSYPAATIQHPTPAQYATPTTSHPVNDSYTYRSGIAPPLTTHQTDGYTHAAGAPFRNGTNYDGYQSARPSTQYGSEAGLVRQA